MSDNQDYRGLWDSLSTEEKSRRIYAALMLDYSKRITKSLIRSKGAKKIAKELVAYIKNEHNYNVNVMYDIVNDKVVMLAAHEVEDRFGKEITVEDVLIQEFSMKGPYFDVNHRDTLNETRAKVISLSVAGCRTWREIVAKIKEEGFHFVSTDKLYISQAISVTGNWDKERILALYKKVPYIFNDAGQTLDDVMSWFTLKRIEDMPLILTEILYDAYGNDILQILTKYGIKEDKYVEGFYNLREIKECLDKEGDSVKGINPKFMELLKMYM